MLCGIPSTAHCVFVITTGKCKVSLLEGMWDVYSQTPIWHYPQLALVNVSEQKFPVSPIEHFDLSSQIAVTNSGVSSVFNCVCVCVCVCLCVCVCIYIYIYIYGHGITIKHGSSTGGPRAARGSRAAATFVSHVCTIKIFNNLGNQMCHLLLYFHVRPAQQATIPDVVLCHKNVGDPCHKESRYAVS